MNTQTSINAAATETLPHRALVREAWRKHAATRQATSAQHAIYVLLMGRSLDRAFTPITNPVKLANGAYPHQGRDSAVRIAASGASSAWAPFSDLIEGATATEKWGRKYYDMSSHELLRLVKDGVK